MQIKRLLNDRVVVTGDRLINSQGEHCEFVEHANGQLSGTPAHVLWLLNIKPAHDREYTDER